MMRNTFGNVFTLTSFGESHGEAVGGVIDGMPAGIEIDKSLSSMSLSAAARGQSALTTSRKSQTKSSCSAGLFEGKSTGAPHRFRGQEHQSPLARL